MPRDGAIIFGDLIDELGMQRIECAKRDPQGPLSARCPDSRNNGRGRLVS
jgi:hypothetical protein